GASFLFVVPTLAAALVGPTRPILGTAFPAVVAAVLWSPIAVVLYDALGLAVPGLAAAPALVLATTLLPLLVVVGRRATIACGGVAAVLVVAACIVPAFDEARPQRVNVVFREDDEGARIRIDTTWGPSSWGAPPRAMKEALGASAREEPAW